MSVVPAGSATPAPSSTLTTNGASPEQLALAAKFGYELFVQPHHASYLTESALASQVELTLLFGWTGSTQRHLSKYAAVHQAQGASTVARVGMIPPFTTIDSKRDALQLLLFLQKVFPHPPKVICHVFSNGGLKPYFGFLHAVETSAQFQAWGKNIIGTVFDSCPARYTVLGFAYVRSMLYRWRLIRFCMFAYALSWGLVSAFFRNFFSGFGLFYKTPTEEDNFGMPILTQSPTLKRTPSLFIYSTSDKMTDYTYVEEFISKMKAERMDIQTVRFEDSEHVAHLMKHPEAYAAKLQAFRKYLLPPETDDWTTMDKTLLRKASAVAEQRISAL